ncbi:MAG TPA: hypothetical protein VGZ03_09150 [Acidimicrobiales bacterium]|nr:hypothetical protein [Acidimicrobiales bacterium]
MDIAAEQESGDTQGTEEAGRPATEHPPRPGEIDLPGGLVAAEPLVGTGSSSPLEEDEPEGTIPPCPLWAMKERRHIQWHLLPSHARHSRIRDVVGSGDETVYVIDDGGHHVMLGRRVGAVQGECEYCLLGRAPVEVYEELRQGRLPLVDAFDSADELELCGVAVEEDIRSSNIFDVAHYDGINDVPQEYRVGAEFLNLEEDLEIT